LFAQRWCANTLDQLDIAVGPMVPALLYVITAVEAVAGVRSWIPFRAVRLPHSAGSGIVTVVRQAGRECPMCVKGELRGVVGDRRVS
jgi:hypothetical protein